VTDPDFRPEAFLVDLDGVLVHSHGLHVRAYELAFSRHRLELDDAVRERIHGGVGRDAVLEAAGVDGEQAQQVSEAKEAAFLELVRDGELEEEPGAGVFLELLLGAGPPVVVVSNSATAQECMEAMGWEKRVRGVVGATDVERLKPDPEPYRRGAAVAGVAPSRCYAFEDSATGAASARGAGCWVAGVGQGVAPDQVDHWAPDLPALPLRRWLERPAERADR